MFGWLKKASPSRDDQALAFVKGVCEAHADIPIMEKKFGPSFEFCLVVPDLKITLDYWWIRRKWSLEMWSGRAQEFLFYNDCLSPPMTKTIAYLRERFGLDEKIEAERKERGDRDRTGKEIADELIRKYSR